MPTLRFVVDSDAAPASTLRVRRAALCACAATVCACADPLPRQVVGSSPELGAWDVERGRDLTFDAASRAWRADVAVTGPLAVDYKLVARDAVDAPWEWQSGSNRRVVLPSAASSTTAPATWLRWRDGTAVRAPLFRAHMMHTAEGLEARRAPPRGAPR